MSDTAWIASGAFASVLLCLIGFCRLIIYEIRREFRALRLEIRMSCNSHHSSSRRGSRPGFRLSQMDGSRNPVSDRLDARLGQIHERVGRMDNRLREVSDEVCRNRDDFNGALRTTEARLLRAISASNR